MELHSISIKHYYDVDIDNVEIPEVGQDSFDLGITSLESNSIENHISPNKHTKNHTPHESTNHKNNSNPTIDIESSNN